MDQVFRALADPSRRQLLDRLNAKGGQTLQELQAGLPMTRQSVSKHLALLEAANLVTTLWRGREKLHYLNAAPIHEIADRWINQYDRQRLGVLADLKKALEENMNDKPEFVYTTYIHTSPERLWRALTEPAFTRQYWMGIALESDWQVGSTITWTRDDVRISDPEQVVLESDPFRRLAYTWLTHTPEFVKSVGLPTDFVTRAAAETRSRVSFDIEQLGDSCKLTVIHDGFDPDGVVGPSLAQGWPVVLSELKTLLESPA
jgi:uncharacterized protein YndB with AHSA1/START domain/DNA-binding transcriptional ArsR family regulator